MNVCVYLEMCYLVKDLEKCFKDKINKNVHNFVIKDLNDSISVYIETNLHFVNLQLEQSIKMPSHIPIL